MADIVTVQGRAVDPQGNGIRNLKVKVEHSGKVEQQDTNSDGSFEFQVPPDTRVRLTYPAEAENFVLPRGGLVLLQPHVDIKLDDVGYEPAAGIVSGVVERQVLKEGKVSWAPLTGLEAVILDRSGRQLSQVKTDPTGRFQYFNPGEQSLTLRFPAEYYSPTEGRFILEDNNEIKLMVDPTRPFELYETVRYTLAAPRVIVQVTDGNQGLNGALVSLRYLDQVRELAPAWQTDEFGICRFDNLMPGRVEVDFPPRFRDSGGNTWELPGGEQEKKQFTLAGGDSKFIEAVVYQKEEHHIVWSVFSDSDDTPVAGILVEVRDEKGENVIDRKLTDETGTVDFILAREGEYQVRVYDDERATAEPRREKVLVQSTYRGRTRTPGPPSTPRTRTTSSLTAPQSSPNGPVAESVIDATAYPILTEEVSYPTPAPRAYGAGAAGTGSMSQTVESTLRDVLGWRPKTTDPKGFTAALTQSFNLKWVEGHTEATWVPRNYAVAVQADMGAITGAQASIYARAKVAVDQSLPLLDRLTSLRTDILPEDQEATRCIVRSELTQLVNELGVEGGPRVQRVDELFNYLLGLPPAEQTPLTVEQLLYAQELVHNPDIINTTMPKPKPWPPTSWTSASPGPFPKWWPQAGTHLGELGLRFGMQRGRVNTIEDEQDLTNFIILVDYITGLWQTWIAQRSYFNRTNTVQPFFGTQMVLLSRALAVVSESVQEVNFTMDSVFLGPAERQTLQLSFTGYIDLPPFVVPDGVPPPDPTYYFDNASPLYVSELLDWIDRVASEEGPRFIQDSGKDGVAALNPTLNNLRAYARGALLLLKKSPTNPFPGVQDPNTSPLPKGYKTPRVQRAISELADSLDQAYSLAYQIQGLQIPTE